MSTSETKPSSPSETGAAVLRAAADQPEGRATPPEYLPAAARNAVVASLLRAGMLEELPPVGGGVAVLRITPASLIAIGGRRWPRRPGRAPTPSRSAPKRQRRRLRPVCRSGKPARGCWRPGTGARTSALSEAVAALRAALTRRRDGGAVRDPASPRRAREGTKGAAVLALLRRPEGATIADVIGVTGWAPHTVRGS